jgi:signal-transduction protein with cAMP-binding, CBS, and nucleotidyltransferase domain
MFKDITFECMIYLLNVLDSRIYLPEEYVMYKDQVGNEMFFIQAGVLEVIDENKDLRVRLYEGDFFGEQVRI